MKRQWNKKRTTHAERLRMERASLIRSLIEDGYNQAMVADKLGVSRQRVNQLLNYPQNRARRLLNYSVKNGYILKPDACEDCNNTGSVQAHHEDYGLPYDVKWFCSDCHVRITDYTSIKRHKRKYKLIAIDAKTGKALTYPSMVKRGKE